VWVGNNPVVARQDFGEPGSCLAFRAEINEQVRQCPKTDQPVRAGFRVRQMAEHEPVCFEPGSQIGPLGLESGARLAKVVQRAPSTEGPRVGVALQSLAYGSRQDLSQHALCHSSYVDQVTDQRVGHAVLGTRLSPELFAERYRSGHGHNHNHNLFLLSGWGG
jgi:hypothetical protein